MAIPAQNARVIYSLPRQNASWELSEETMPESVVHDEAVDLLKLLLLAWVARAGRSARVARNLAVRWDQERPKVGVDPDLCLLDPAPPLDAAEISSIRTWMPGQKPPRLAIEVVSDTNPHKDYVVAPDKYAVSGTMELWVFDPLLAGPSSQGGPFRIQTWNRNAQGELVRTYAGEGPARSAELSAWLVATEDGRKLRIANDEAGRDVWPTEAEAERAARERERTEKERERTEKERALARIAELEAQLKGR